MRKRQRDGHDAGVACAGDEGTDLALEIAGVEVRGASLEDEFFGAGVRVGEEAGDPGFESWCGGRGERFLGAVGGRWVSGQGVEAEVGHVTALLVVGI